MDWTKYDLITFGCSHTYGAGLPDCWIPNKGHGPKPSNSAWPSVLKQKLNFKSLDNSSRPGASNKMIAKTIIEYPEYTKQSVVVVLWANYIRHTIYTNKNKNLHMLPQMMNGKFKHIIQRGVDKDDFMRKVKSYYEDFYEEFDSIFDQTIRMNYIHAFLKSKGILNFHLIQEHSWGDHKKYFNKFMIDNIHAKTFNWKKDFKIDDALDKPDPHPGLASHVHLSNFIKEWLDSCD
mgnify:FL=1|tara:strand:- start:10028 stop:10729 length:702 start_codon:yes stop_codon:yes gene_type:complete